ncbi:hypothetical protein Dsin_023722 [Dipteronia sinensis]|uniref:Uncharacterized protein n=1 Tax=Dipteronia sinensis TaxID=43782 RepID=A0AAE0E2D7_9ROSI|nr:hypothetical protein Dsin_023722 [Dipteronia sinensis]
MGLIGMCLPFVLVQILLLMVANAALTTTQLAQGKPGCPKKCGDLQIPYPFGTETKCSLNKDFIITCNHTHYNPPVPFWGDSKLIVTNITLDGRFQVQSIVSQDCYHFPVKNHSRFGASLFVGNHFRISETQNKFTVIGCDSYGYILGKIGKKSYSAGCISSCESRDDVIDGSCSGFGCCQIDIPKELRKIRVYASSFKEHINVSHFNPCSYAFVIEDSQFNFSSSNLSMITEKVPVAVDWSIIGHGKCINGTGYACHENTFCYEANNSAGGYLCNCSVGYQGNPYLSHGCKDIDECKQGSHKCHKDALCENIQGNYTCKCCKGYNGDGRQDGEGCTPNMLPVSTIGLCVGLSFVMVLVASSWIYCVFRNRRLIKLKEEFFKKNGGFLLQQQLPKGSGRSDTRIIFTENELKMATNNFDEDNIICKGSNGVVYKGILNEYLVAIKKPKKVDQSQEFIKEVIVLLKIKHRNVIKLLGCCLETKVPILVYEYASNGTLFEHIHNNDKPTIPWEIRLRIAAETAGVLSYLHYTADDTPIIHRDVKSSNILLDDNFIVKVSDFGASMLDPMDETKNDFYQIVQSTRGYLDPEYLCTEQFTEKSDVYSFGVVLLELMTGKEVISFKRPPKDKLLVTYFHNSLEEGRLSEILQNDLVNIDIKKVAELARRCSSLKGDERPSMKEVVMELDELIKNDA